MARGRVRRKTSRWTSVARGLVVLRILTGIGLVVLAGSRALDADWDTAIAALVASGLLGAGSGSRTESWRCH